MSQFDLGASRRKRGIEPKELVVTGDDGEVLFKAPVAPEMPAATLDAGQAGNMGDALRSMFLVDADADLFMEEFTPSLDDLAAMMEGLYGQDELGKPSASGKSSTSGGTK